MASRSAVVMPGVAAASTGPFAAIEQQVQGSSADPASQRTAAIAALRDLLTGPAGQQSESRERAVQALAKTQGVPVELARGQVATYEQQYRQAAEQAKQAASRAAEVASRSVFWTMMIGVVALLLGAAAAWWGGRESVVSPTLTHLAQRAGRTARPT